MSDSDFEEKKNIAQMLSDFQDKTDAVLAEYVRHGYLKTIARALLYMSYERAKEVLQEFDENTREKLTELMQANDNFSEHYDRPDPYVMEAENAFASMNFYPLDDLVAIEIQRRKEYEKDTKEVFAQFLEKNPIYGQYLKTLHFEFGTILQLDDRAIQKLLREIDCQELATALIDCPEEIQNKILKNMSVRAAKYLKDNIAELSSLVTRQNIEESRTKICSIISRLEDCGEILRCKQTDSEENMIAEIQDFFQKLEEQNKKLLSAGN